MFSHSWKRFETNTDKFFLAKCGFFECEIILYLIISEGTSNWRISVNCLLSHLSLFEAIFLAQKIVFMSFLFWMWIIIFLLMFYTIYTTQWNSIQWLSNYTKAAWSWSNTNWALKTINFKWQFCDLGK